MCCAVLCCAVLCCAAQALGSSLHSSLSAVQHYMVGYEAFRDMVVTNRCAPRLWCEHVGPVYVLKKLGTHTMVAAACWSYRDCCDLMQCGQRPSNALQLGQTGTKQQQQQQDGHQDIIPGPQVPLVK
jgi:hypothetical protein